MKQFALIIKQSNKGAIIHIVKVEMFLYHIHLLIIEDKKETLEISLLKATHSTTLKVHNR